MLMELRTALLRRFQRGIATPAATVLEVLCVTFRYRIWLCSAPCPGNLNEEGLRSKGLIDLAVELPRQRSFQADTCLLFVDFGWFPMRRYGLTDCNEGCVFMQDFDSRGGCVRRDSVWKQVLSLQVCF